MKRSLAVAAVAMTTSAIVLAGCAVDTAAPGSSSGGPLTVACGAMEDWCQAMTAKFKAETGIETNFVRLSSGETVARLEASKASPEFGVWHGGPADGYGAAADAGLLEKYTPPTASEIPEKYRDPDGYWTGVYIGALGFCSNQKVLDSLGVEVPTTWEALLNPKLSKQIGTAHPSTSGTAFTTLWTQVTLAGGDADKAFGYMRSLHNNVLQYSKSGTAPGQAAGRGEVAVGLVFTHDCVKYKEAGMTDLVVSLPAEGTGYEIGGVAVIKGAKNMDAAKKYADWALKADTQAIGVTVGSYQVTTNPNAPKDDRMIDLSKVKLVDYDFEAAATAKKELTSRFDAEIAAAPKE